MGMAAPQGRLLLLTARKADLMFDLNICSMEKSSLSRDVSNLNKKFQNDLNAKKFVWNINQGATTTDLSYEMLMHPNSANAYKPYLITDMHDKVVVDKNLEAYAKIISPDGSPVGSWEDKRAELISAITGVSKEDMDKQADYEADLKAAEDNLNSVLAKKPDLSTCEKTYGYEELLAYMGSEHEYLDTGLGSTTFGSAIKGASVSNWQQAYNNEDAYFNISSSADNGVKSTQSYISAILKEIRYALDDLFLEEGHALFHEAYLKDKTKTEYKDMDPGYLDNGDNGTFDTVINELEAELLEFVSKGGHFEDGTYPIEGSSIADYKINVKTLMDEIFARYQQAKGEPNKSDNKVVGYDRDKAKVYFEKTLPAWQEEYNKAVTEYNNIKHNNEGLLTSADKQKIAFYEKVFDAIAEKGWTYNNQVNDSNYLNQMLQNNLYMITTINEVEKIKTNQETAETITYYDNEYTSELASNCKKLTYVNDKEAQQQAQLDYEFEKDLLNEKETRIDLRMQELNLELQATTSRMESLKSMMGESIDRSFTTFT